MKKNIPTYSIDIFSKEGSEDSEVFLLDKRIQKPKIALKEPFRSNYFGLSVCVQGRAEVKANLETYQLKPNYLIVLSPQVIRQFKNVSEDYKTISIFFTKSFLSTSNQISPYKFNFFDSGSKLALHLSDTQSENIISSLKFLRLKYQTPHVYRFDILRNLIIALMYEVSSIYNEQGITENLQNRAQLLTHDFKKLVHEHSPNERSVKYYADRLFITPKHLSETVKKTTGKTAGNLISESVILEAKILLQNPMLTISQVADSLHFTDQSTFGKFFKNITGLSPAAYRQS